MISYHLIIVISVSEALVSTFRQPKLAFLPERFKVSRPVGGASFRGGEEGAVDTYPVVVVVELLPRTCH